MTEEEAIKAIKAAKGDDADDVVSLSLSDLLGSIFDVMGKPKPAKGSPTGIAELDSAIGGFRRGNVTILGAKRSFGKTSFSIMACEEAMKASKCCLMIAGEDSERMYGARFMARRANIPAICLRDMEWPNDSAKARDLQKAAQAVHDAPKIPFFVRSAGRPAEWVVKVIKKAAATVDLDLVCVDYLQCIRAQKRQQDRRNEVTYVARIITDAIKEVNAAGLLLSQLKRTEHDRPEIEDLKESGDLEDMAEHVLLGWREEVNGGQDIRKLICAKNKDGVDEMKDIECPFDLVTASFVPTYGAGTYVSIDNAEDPMADFDDLPTY